MSERRDLMALIGMAIVVAAIAAIGIGVRATYGAQTSADEPQYLLSALSLWEDGNLDIADELAEERYRDFHEVDLPEQTLQRADGRRISPHDPLLPALLAIPMGLGGWMGAKVALAFMGGALAALLAWTMVNRFGVSLRVAFATAGIFALAPPLAVYSTQAYPEIAAAIALLAGYAAVTGPFTRPGRFVLVAAVIALPWLAVKFVPVAAVLAVAGLVRAGKGSRGPLVWAMLAGGVLYIVGHLSIYGGMTAYAAGDHFVGGEFTAVGAQLHLWGRSTRLLGLLVDRGFGIGAWQPAYLILPLVAAWSLARRGQRFVIAAALLVVGWLMATFVALTMHGWWFPGRQLVVVLPVAAMLIGAWADQARVWQKALLGVAGTLGVVAFAYLLWEGLDHQLTWVVDFGATTDPFYRALTIALPDYMTTTTATWVLHGFWVFIALVMAWLGWRSGSLRGSHPAPTDLLEIEGKERVLT